MFFSMSNLNHKERYVVDIVGDEVKLHDTFAQTNVLSFQYSEKYRNSAITLAALLNSFWTEISALREKADQSK